MASSAGTKTRPAQRRDVGKKVLFPKLHGSTFGKAIYKGTIVKVVDETMIISGSRGAKRTVLVAHVDAMHANVVTSEGQYGSAEPTRFTIPLCTCHTIVDHRERSMWLKHAKACFEHNRERAKLVREAMYHKMRILASQRREMEKSLAC